MAVKLAIVVPCYNEQEVLPETIGQLKALLEDMMKRDKITSESAIFFVDDGCQDNTWEVIQKAHEESLLVRGIKLAGNVGHQSALLAGLFYVKESYDACITIDADLQDDIGVMEQMIDYYVQGKDIVFGVRSDRSTDTFFKRWTAQGFYRFMSWLGIKSVYNHADFRLMSKRAMEALSRYPERNLFLRGIVSHMGFATACVYYSRKERQAGESKYPFRKMVRFAFDGITSFSIKPMDYIMGAGIFMILFTIVMAIYSLIRHANGEVVPGWTSLWLSIWFVGGIMTFSIGLVGEYIGKIYMEVKERPRYLIDTVLDVK